MSDDEVGDLYDLALVHEKAGENEQAIAIFLKVLELDPDDHGGVMVRLAALGHVQTPDRAGDIYVANLFDQHADQFEAILVGQLGYDVPNLMREMLLRQDIGDLPLGLDLGCGTGLVAEALSGLVDHWVGIDLSEEMAAICYDKELYDDVYVGEVVAYLDEGEDGPFDLIVAADVLPYLGDVAPLFAGVAARLHGEGCFLFSTQSMRDDERGDYVVGQDHRFHHASDYLEAQLDAVGLMIVDRQDINVRNEEGAPTPGELIFVRFAD